MYWYPGQWNSTPNLEIHFWMSILHLAGAFSSWKDDDHHLQIEDIF